MEHWARQCVDIVFFSRKGEARYLRPARIGESQDARHLIKRFTGRVVTGLTDLFIGKPVLNEHQFRVSAADQKREHRKLNIGNLKFFSSYKRRENMSFHVVNRYERTAPDERECFGKIDTDPQRRLKPGTVRESNSVYLRDTPIRDKSQKLFQEFRLANKKLF